MLRIRLSRTGKKRQPSYRVVVAEVEAKRDGRIIERIGHYNPLTNPAEYHIKEDRALYWLSVGAQPSDAVRILLEKQGTIGRLARLHAGESLESLVSEYQGVAPTATPAKTKSDKGGETVLERVTETVSDAAAAVAAPVAAVAEKVEDAVESAIDKVEDAVKAVLDADEEE